MSGTLDYIFFRIPDETEHNNQGDKSPYAQFMAFLFAHKVESEATAGEDSIEIRISDDLDEELQELIEDRYEELFALNQQLMEAASSTGSAGVVVNLKDGTTTYADIPADILSRIMSVITPEEMGDVVNAIADAIEAPDHRPLCQRTEKE